MAVNKVVYGATVLVDLTQDTATEEDVSAGKTFHLATGEKVTGVAPAAMNVQIVQSTTRISNSSYTKACSLTCSKTGTYDVYWDCFRTTAGGTSGSQLYIGSSAHGSANTTFTNDVQTNHVTGVRISANQEVSVYARSKSNGSYAYVGTLAIFQTA